MQRIRFYVLPFVTLSVCFFAAQALAQSTTKQTDAASREASASQTVESPEYKRSVAEGVRQFSRKNYEEARAAFATAHALFPNARTMRALGMVEFEQRNYVEAVRDLEGALSSTVMPLDAEMRAQAEELLARAKLYVALVVIESKPEPSRVLIDGVAVDVPAGGAILLRIGEHTLEVQAPGYVPERRTLNVAGGEEQKVALVLKSESMTGEPTEVEPSEPAPRGPSGSAMSPPAHRRRVWTWALGGGALLASGVGVGLGVAAQNKVDEYSKCKTDSGCQHIRDKGDALALGATVSFVTGGALLAGAVVAFFLEGRGQKERPARAMLTLEPGGLGVAGRF